MRQIIVFIIFIAIITIIASPIAAQSTNSAELDKFKEKLASKVAELTKKNQKVISGVVESVASKKFRLKTATEGQLDVKLDSELTKFFLISGNETIEKELSDLKKGAYVIISGPLVDKVVDANIIYQDEEYLVNFGKIIEVDRANNTIVVLTAAKERATLDIEIGTKQQILDIKTLETETTGLSKIKEGDGIHFVVKKQTKVKNRFEAVRILIIPQEYFINK